MRVQLANTEKSETKAAPVQTVVLLLIFALFSMTPHDAGKKMGDWMSIPLSRMIGTSDLIVYGEVKTVSDSTILVGIIKRVTGTEKENTIEVIKARPDPFAGLKPAPYRSGQRYLFFLESKTAAAKKSWKVMGNAQEGQMPVVEPYIYFTDRHFNGLPLARYQVNGAEQDIQRFDFPLFLSAVSDYKKCYRWIRSGQDNKFLPEKNSSGNESALYGKQSFIHNFLVTETELIIANK